MDLCDISDAVFYIGGGNVPNVVIDQRKIGLEQRRDDDAAIVGELIFVIINIDDVCVIANVIVILARPFDDAAAGLIAAICVDQTRPKCLSSVMRVISSTISLTGMYHFGWRIVRLCSWA